MTQAPAMPAALAPQAVDELAARLRLAIGRLSRLLGHRVKGDLTLSQWSALSTVSRTGPLRLGDLAACEHVAAPTLSRVVTALEEQGFVERRPDPDDARAGLLSLTEAGERRLRQLRSDGNGLLARALVELAGPERETLAAALPGLEALVERLCTREPNPHEARRTTAESEEA